ncbi:helix-turn-helix domain-containing protein [Virgibacillus kimchii]
MDAKIYEYIDVLRQDEQPESVVEVLLYLGRSSLRIKGVSFAKNQTIADGIGMSVSTVKRVLKALREYGMIESITNY